MEEGKNEGEVAGARGQSADRNYRRAHEWGQLTWAVRRGRTGAESSEKRRLGGGISGFWCPLGDGLGSFPRKWGFRFGMTIATVKAFKIEPGSKELDLRMFGA